jgi:hypothetical protein
VKLPILYGQTHDADTGDLTARVPRVTKVAIGKTKDSGLHVYLATAKDGKVKAALEIGRGDRIETRAYELDQIALLKRDYAALLKDPTVVKRRAPEKLSYFTFFREAGDGTYVHDIDCIVKHGPLPRELDVVITDEQPLFAAYQFWSKAELRCSGDGINAMRSVNFTPAPGDKEAAEQAKEMGRRFFPIVEGCFTRGCPFAQAARNAKGYEVKQCGVHGSLSFQLVNDIRLGAKAEFTTTGGRSVRQLAAGLNELATFTGGGDPDRGTVRGIPLVLSVGQFKTNHNGQPGTAYAVRLEFRAESVPAMQKKILEAAKTFGQMMPMLEAPAAAKVIEAVPLQIEAAKEEEPTASQVVVEAAVSTDPGDVDDGDGVYQSAQFEPSDDDTIDNEDAEAIHAAAEQSYAETRAKLMEEAEAGAAQGCLIDDDQKDEQKQYVDPGEQGEVKQTGRPRVRMGK